jgi:hypothetical protein
MSKERPDYVKCIRKGDSRESLCGRQIGLREWVFRDMDHVRDVGGSGFLLPCIHCIPRLRLPVLPSER